MTETRKPSPRPRGCNLPGCVEPAVVRGLCDAHWSTHRGLADPEPEVDTSDKEALP